MLGAQVAHRLAPARRRSTEIGASSANVRVKLRSPLSLPCPSYLLKLWIVSLLHFVEMGVKACRCYLWGSLVVRISRHVMHQLLIKSPAWPKVVALRIHHWL